MDQQIGPYFIIGMQGSMDRRIGLHFWIGIQGSKDRQIAPKLVFYILVGKIRFTDQKWSLTPVEYVAKKSSVLSWILDKLGCKVSG